MRYIDPDRWNEDGSEETGGNTCGWNGSLALWKPAECGPPVRCPVELRERLAQARELLVAKVQQQKARGLIT